MDKLAIEQIALIIKENKEVKKINLARNYIGQEGLNMLCQTLSEDESKVEEFDISDNDIPDSSLKTLFALL